MTVRTTVIKTIVSLTDLPYVQIQSGKRLQLIPDIASLPFCQRNQSAAFIASHQMLVVWDDSPTLLVRRTEDIQQSLMSMFCGEGDDVSEDMASKGTFVSTKEYEDYYDLAGIDDNEERRPQLWQCVYTSMALLLMISALGSGFRQIAIQQMHKPDWRRFLFVIPLAGQIWLSLVWRTRYIDTSTLTDTSSSSSKPSLATWLRSLGLARS
jgi:hypothetical protein